MPNTKLNKQRLSNHFHYNRGSYLFIILASILIAVFDMKGKTAE